MRPLAFIGTAAVLAVVAVVFLWPPARSGPEPIEHGRDACAQCRMPLTRPGFAGELRNRDGALTKYDDVGCMLRAMLAMHAEVPEAWVEDHETFELVPLLAATLVQSSDADTPMASGLLAFEDPAAADAFVGAHGGEVVALETLLRDPTRFAAAPSRTVDAARAVTMENP
jgi:copper chaperone NosL